MPLVQVKTNLPKAQVWPQFAAELEAKVQNIMDCKYVNLVIEADQLMQFFGATQSPAVYIDLTLAGLDKTQCNHYITELTKFVSSALRIPKRRIVMWCHDVDLWACAIGGRTFEQLKQIAARKHKSVDTQPQQHLSCRL